MPINKESEKALERKLCARVKEIRGWTIKLLPYLLNGLPDRLVLHNGRAYFVEVKTTGEKPSPAQAIMHRRLEQYGFIVCVLDCSEGIEDFINYLELL